MSEDVAASLIDALGLEGEYVDEGGFSLDPTKARTKLRDYQLAEPLGYVLLLVEAATVAHGEAGPEAPRIHFELGATTIAQFAGVQLREDQLRNLFATVFRRPSADEDARRSRVLQLLALAANAALAAGAERVEIEAPDQHGCRHRLVVPAELDTEPRCEQLDELSSGSRCGHGTTSTARHPPTLGSLGSLGVCFRFCGSTLELGRPRRERELLLERCELSTTAISIGGDRIDAGFAAAFAGFRRVETTQVVLDEIGIVGQAGRVGSEPARALIMTRGVLAETVALPDCRPGLVAVVDVDLRKDLSQSRIMRDRAYDELLAAIARADARLPWASAKLDRHAGEDAQAGPMFLVVGLLVLAFALVVLIAVLRTST